MTFLSLLFDVPSTCIFIYFRSLHHAFESFESFARRIMATHTRQISCFLLIILDSLNSFSLDTSRNILSLLVHTEISTIHTLYCISMFTALEATVRTDTGRKNFIESSDLCLYSSVSHCTLISKRESELVETTRTTSI